MKEKPKPQALATAADIGTWQARMRGAVLETLEVEDIREIIEAIKTKAKAGDLQAARLLLSYAVGNPPRGDETAVAVSAPATKAAPASEEKIEVLARRYANGLPLHVNGDGGKLDLS